MVTCTFDFIIFPILYALVQILFQGNVTQQWHPITLEGAGLYHVAMGAVLGVSAWTRGHEKMLMEKNRDYSEYNDRVRDEYGTESREDRDTRFPELR